MEEKNGSVTIQQFNEWIVNNIKYTWNYGDSGFRNGALPIFKYFYPCLDTRDMRVFRIEYSGSIDDGCVDFQNCEKNTTILDLLDNIVKTTLEQYDAI